MSLETEFQAVESAVVGEVKKIEAVAVKIEQAVVAEVEKILPKAKSVESEVVAVAEKIESVAVADFNALASKVEALYAAVKVFNQGAPHVIPVK